MLRRLLVVSALALFAAACASTGTKVDDSKVQAFQRGKTTYPEVVASLGAPQANLLSDDGSRTVTYSYAQASARPENFIPYVGVFAGGADSKLSGYTFKFDKDGLLVSYSAITGQNSINTGLLNQN